MEKPAPLEKPAEKLIKEPFLNFINAQQASGWLLICMTVLAVALANSPWAEQYLSFLSLPLAITLGEWRTSHSLLEWTNDGLMALFFFLLGLELKRELIVGQLSSRKKAASIICAGLGGMVLPALLYLAVVSDALLRQGWAIPVATDAAFALMMLLLLGRHVPAATRAFLVGLAIVDDLGAIMLIGLVYTSDIDPGWALPSLAAFALLWLLNLTGMRSGLLYFAGGLLLWICFGGLGLHGTLAGVAVAFTAPVNPSITGGSFLSRLKQNTDKLEAKRQESDAAVIEEGEQQAIALRVRETAAEATPPVARWHMQAEKPISFFVMPVFAFMNAGFVLSAASFTAAWSSNLSYAILIGLLFGKPLGIAGGLWLGHRFGLAALPNNLTWRHIWGIGMLGSIGFTMSLFIATLSFGDQSTTLDIAKQAIITTSIIGGLGGYIWLRWFCESDADTG